MKPSEPRSRSKNLEDRLPGDSPDRMDGDSIAFNVTRLDNKWFIGEGYLRDNRFIPYIFHHYRRDTVEQTPVKSKDQAIETMLHISSMLKSVLPREDIRLYVLGKEHPPCTKTQIHPPFSAESGRTIRDAPLY